MRRAPRCPRRSGGVLVEINVADARSSFGSFLGAFHAFLEFLLQHLGLVLFCFHGLAEEGFAPATLFFHSARTLFKIIEGLGALPAYVRGYTLGGCIHFEHSATAG